MKKAINENYSNDEYYFPIIGRNIRKYRDSANMTQQDLADMTGISRQYICDLENEKRNKRISINYLTRISDALNIPIDEFFKD